MGEGGGIIGVAGEVVEVGEGEERGRGRRGQEHTMILSMSGEKG